MDELIFYHVLSCCDPDFDVLNPKSNQFISVCNCTYVVNLVKFSQVFCEIKWPQTFTIWSCIHECTHRKTQTQDRHVWELNAGHSIKTCKLQHATAECLSALESLHVLCISGCCSNDSAVSATSQQHSMPGTAVNYLITGIANHRTWEKWTSKDSVLLPGNCSDLPDLHNRHTVHSTV